MKVLIRVSRMYEEEEKNWREEEEGKYLCVLSSLSEPLLPQSLTWS